jgi:tetratricopeptide (TPR) repeat protein
MGSSISKRSTKNKTNKSGTNKNENNEHTPVTTNDNKPIATTTTTTSNDKPTTTTTKTNDVVTPPTTTTTTKTPIEITKVKGGIKVGGISVRHFIDFVKKNIDYSNPTITMNEFVAQVIKPKTSEKKESYLEYLARENESAIRATAEYFVSYVWAYPLKELINALDYTLLQKLKNDDVFIWLDGCCFNQHRVESHSTPQLLSDTFGETLKAIGKVAMVLVNWRDPSYSKRMWCVFEAYMSKVSNAQITLAMSQNEEENLVHAMVTNEISPQYMGDLVGTVNVEKAEAKEPRDQEIILQLIRQYGIPEVNGVVTTNLRRWIVDVGEIALQSVAPNSKDAAYVCLARRAIHQALGEYHEALKWSEKSLEIWEQVPEAQESVKATIYNNMAETLESLGRFTDAYEINEKGLEINSRVLGPDHASTITSLAWKANILQFQGKFADALVVINQVLTARERLDGSTHENTANCYVNRAGCLRHLGKFEDAYRDIEHGLQIQTNKLGPDHITTVTSMALKGNILRAQGKYDDALQVFDQVLSARRRIYGDMHPDITTSLKDKAGCLRSLQRLDEALAMFDQTLKMRIKLYGEKDHPDVAMSYNDKGSCLSDMGKNDQARECFASALEIYRKYYGEEHSNVATALWWIARIERSSGNDTESKKYFHQAIDIFTRTLGKDHPSTLQVVKDMGE